MKKKWIWIIVSTLSILFICGGIITYMGYHTVKQTISEMHEPLAREKSEKRIEEIHFVERDPVSILLLGVDERGNDRGRSDTMIVMTVNPNDESIKMVSIPRDTRTEIVGKGFDDKINHAYAFGGAEMSIATVENLLDIPVDHYIRVNMESFRDIVDAVGGVTVNNTLYFTYEGYTFHTGPLELDGKKALAFSRMRYEDPRGDFGRQERQRQIIEAVINKGASFSSLAKYQNIFEVIGKNIKTDLSFEQIYDLQKNYKEARHSIEQMQVKGSGTMIDGIYYYIVSENERLSLSNILKKHLAIGTDVIDNGADS